MKKGVRIRMWERQYTPVVLVVIAAVAGAFEESQLVPFVVFLLVFVAYHQELRAW